MRSLILLAGAALAMTVTPASAEAKPKGAKAHVNARGHVDINRNGIADWRERQLADINGNGVLDYRERRLVDLNRNGIADWRERWIDRDRDGIDDRAEMGRRYGANACPPGLAKKNNGCLPPGQAKRMFAEGQRLPAGYRYWTPYSSIPNAYYDRYDLDDDYRYILRDQYLYEVDPLTMLIRRVIGL